MKKLLIITFLIAAALMPATTRANDSLLVMMHFDDGYRGVYENAFPLMEKYNYQGTVFMPTTLIDRYAHLYLDQLQSLKNAGWEIGSHTRTHPDLRTLDQGTLVDEIVGSRNYLEAKELLTLETAYFCSPMTIWNEEIRELVNNHYVAARAKDLIIFDAQKQPHQHLRVVLKETRVAHFDQWIREAIADDALLILIFHEIAEGGNEYFFSPAKFEGVLKLMKQYEAESITIEEFIKRHY